MLEIGLPLGFSSHIVLTLLILLVFNYGPSVYRNRKRQIPKGWEKSWQDVKALMPYIRLWDKPDWRNTLGYLVAVVLCVGAIRGINVLSLILRRVLDQLSVSSGRKGPFPWKEVTGYILLHSGLSNVIDCVQWIITRRLECKLRDQKSIAMYSKMMFLSADYHDKKNSGTVWVAVRNSGYTISGFISSIC